MALLVLTFTLVTSLTASSVFIFSNEFSNEGLDFFVSVYINPLTRAPAFFVGMIYGYGLHLVREKKSRIPTKLSYCLTALSIIFLNLIIYCQFKGDESDFKFLVIKNTFDSFLRPFWALGVGWIIFVCHTGSGGPINWFLSLNMWKIPSRVSYAIYLTHLSLMIIVYSNAVNLLYFTVERMMIDAMSFILLILVVSFVVTILIDSPFAILFRLLLGLTSKIPEIKEERKEVSVNGDVSVLQQRKEN